MSEANRQIAENSSDRHDTVVESARGAAQCYFRPETEELVFIAGSEIGPFESHWRELMTDMDAFHEARTRYSRLLETYGRAAMEPLRSARRLDERASAVDKAESELEQTRERLRKKLGAFANIGSGYDQVVELIPVAQGPKNKGRGKAPRYAYVKKGYFSKTREGNKLHSVSLKGNEKDGGAASIFIRDKHGNTRIDTRKLGKQLTTLQSPKVKFDLQRALKLMGSDFDLSTLNKDFVLFDWAQQWNDSLLSERQGNANVDVSSGAQFMRFVSNVSASGQFDPNNQQASFKGEAKTSLTLASGCANATFYAPDRLGWPLRIETEEGKAFDLGMLRVRMETELNGFLGGSAQLEAQLQVVMEGDRQGVAGQPGGRLPRFRERRTTGRRFHQAMDANDEGVQLSGEAFAGVRLEGSLKGSIQWLKPTPPPDESISGALPNNQASGQFTTFCTFGHSMAGLLGAGSGGKLRCTFINGRFCFHVAASLCWGAGAKGAFLAEVDAATIAEFGAWLVYQLYSLDYSFFDVVERETFEAYSQYCVMQMANMEEQLYERYLGELKIVDDLSNTFREFVEDILAEGRQADDASKKRNVLARNVIQFKLDLLQHTPESKGILLYLLTRHGKADHVDSDNRSLLGDIYSSRKEAVICVLSSIQTLSEWEKVLCRISVDGVKLSEGLSDNETIKQQEEDLVRFLQEGYNRDVDLHRAKSSIQAIHHRLKRAITYGYALAFNDTCYYSLHRHANTQYPGGCEFGPWGDEQLPIV
jgi:hypothetical protein